ncbi:hypothetical protein BI364_11655 [Acidihalobacter yilgarnensis]|uniref:ATP-grasp domain-containing protein n=2 Tax=Acidihalobacter yilgarnensis TaxID=2819280 RepID=A0A1D8IPY4_9GAMM|nr:hypothetical protein BI364_11655 [Acidihalobacter yilgarnensis]
MGGPVPALVLGSGFNGLGVARSLGMLGVPVYLADTDTKRPEMRTRYAHPLKIAALQGDPLIRDLQVLAQTRLAGPKPVLVLTQEQTVRTVGSAQAILSPLFRFLLPPAGILDTLMHKAGFDRLAAQTGLRVPRTVQVREAADVDTALALTCPLIIKPAVHAPAYEQRFRKAYRVEDANTARELLGRILDVLPDVVVQEWIPGNDSDIYFCLQQLAVNGQIEASFVGRKIRSWPPNVGGTASCIAAPECAELSAITANFFTRVEMCGLASMEYKRHATTGEFVAIEPTVGRTDYQEEVATLNGMNLPYAYYCSARGRHCHHRSVLQTRRSSGATSRPTSSPPSTPIKSCRVGRLNMVRSGMPCGVSMIRGPG